jgi:hypothetical protein
MKKRSIRHASTNAPLKPRPSNHVKHAPGVRKKPAPFDEPKPQSRYGQPPPVKYGESVPTKFELIDTAWLMHLRRRSGLSCSEIVRRGLRLLIRRIRSDPNWNWIEHTSMPLTELPPTPENCFKDLLVGAADTTATRIADEKKPEGSTPTQKHAS